MHKVVLHHTSKSGSYKLAIPTKAGLMDTDTLKLGDLVGVNKDNYLILDALPSKYDSLV